MVINKYAPGQEPMIIKTAQITIDPDKSLARTNLPVTIIQGKNTLHGIGLLGNLKTGDAEILSHIRERYTSGGSG